MSDVGGATSQGRGAREPWLGALAGRESTLSVLAFAATAGGGLGILALLATPVTEHLTDLGGSFLWAQFSALFIGGALAGIAALVEQWSAPYAGDGRAPERRDAWSAPVELSDDDTQLVVVPSLEIPQGLLPILALAWRETARREHALVASLAERSVALVAAGAPPELVRDAHTDALDEIRHAQVCFAVARQLDGEATGPASYPEAITPRRPVHRDRASLLTELARAAVIDGALGEGVSARVKQRLAQRCALIGPRAALRQLAADEARHAENAWRLVRWCVEEGGEPVRRALVELRADLPEGPRGVVVADARDGSCEAFGVHGESLERAEYTWVRAHVRRELARLVGPLELGVAA